MDQGITFVVHLGDVRHRAEVVEYRAEQRRDILRDRLAALAAPFVTTSDTTIAADALRS